jgi:Pyruvate/2-oxoacid:ferredoxin oxidoreductase delta subunit
MLQVPIHGRGGQGVVTAAELPSPAAFDEGRHTHAFPTFGSERMGAPVTAFCRFDDRPIRAREPIAETDSVVLALGRDVDLSLLDHVPGIEVDVAVVAVDQRMMTGYEGVFAGGDMVPAQCTVTVGIGHGKKATRHTDGLLRGGEYAPPPKAALATFGMLKPWYFADAPKTVRPTLETARRQSTFDEVVGGLDDSTALYEARRCMSCGNCFACANCYGVCPDNAVLKPDPTGAYTYAYDLDYCKGCGICAEECPCGAIAMEPETI